jgi:hypothetical protein
MPSCFGREIIVLHVTSESEQDIKIYYKDAMMEKA